MIYIYITFTSYLVATMLIFFFLRGTSPTDIYTLSLHDALPIFILTTFDDDELVLEGLRAGARGYLLKEDRKSTRLNSSHVAISYAVFCLKKKIREKEGASAIASVVESRAQHRSNEIHLDSLYIG